MQTRDKEQLPKPEDSLKTLYQIASPSSRMNPLGYDDQPYPDRLFVIESDLEDEREFREDLDELFHALQGPHRLIPIMNTGISTDSVFRG